MLIQEGMSLQEKLGILADAAKYDVSCSSSGSQRRGKAGMLGHTVSPGICHSFAADVYTRQALGSDAFFPFGDNIDRAYKSGVKYIAQPGGSVRDDNVIETCDKYGICLLSTSRPLVMMALMVVLPPFPVKRSVCWISL